MALLSAATMLLTGCGGEDSVVTAVVGRQTVTEVVEAPATVSARASATLTAPADGRVVSIAVADGDVVQPGTAVVRIDSPQAMDRLQRARAALAAVSQAPGTPQIDLSGLQAQVDAAAHEAFGAAREAADGIPKAELRDAALAKVARSEQTYQAARAQSQAALEGLNSGLATFAEGLSSLTAAQEIQARSAVEIAQDTVDRLVVRAPISGTVQLTMSAPDTGAGGLDALLGELPTELAGQAGELLGAAGDGATGSAGVPTDRTLRVGAPVSAGATLAVVVDAAALSLAAEVDETDVFLVQPGVPATVQVDAAPGASYAASVVSVDLAPTASTRGGVSYRVVLTLGPGTMGEGAGEQIAPRPRPGMSAVARLQVRQATDVVAVPVSAVVRDAGDDVVWVSVGGSAERREVTLGAQGEETVEVTAGLGPGETVVVSGADTVEEGQELP